MRQPSPTLHDVARVAGVSTATVSRCLNSPGQVIESTRVKVNKAIQDLGYSPNFGARVMAARRTNTIGAIIPTMENAIFARGLQAFQEELRKNGYTLLVASSSYRPEVEEEQIRSLIARGADGLLLIGHERDPAINRFLETQNVPALVAWAYDATAVLPSIGFDNLKSMCDLATKVIEMGHRHIGLITAETNTNDRARQRVRGIQEAAKTAGISPDNLCIIETSYGIETGAKALETLMSAKPRPTVVMCGNDVLAVGAIRRARELGYDVPADVSITGFDDIEIATVVAPQLTTVHVPHREMGTNAAKALIEMVEDNKPGEVTELKVSIRLRESLAPPAG